MQLKKKTQKCTVYYVFILMLLFQFPVYHASGQSVYKHFFTKNNIYQSGVLKIDQEIKGYYQLYEVEKISRGISKFNFELIDANLELVARHEFNHSNTKNKFTLAFDGSHIITKHYHARNNNEVVKKFDLGLNLLDSYNIKPKDQITFDPIPTGGFLKTQKNGKNVNASEILLRLDHPNYASWKQKLNRKDFQVGSYEVFDSIVIFFNHLLKPSGKKAFTYGIDLRSGKTLFKNHISYSTSKRLLYNGSYKTSYDEFVVCMEYFNTDYPPSPLPSGIILTRVNANGRKEKIKSISFTNEIFSKLGDLKRFRNFNVHVEDIIKLNEDKYMLVGQIYKAKSFKGVVTSFDYFDVFALELNKNLEPTNLEIMPNNMSMRPSDLYDLNIKFVQKSKDNSIFSIVSIDPDWNDDLKISEINYQVYEAGEWTKGVIKPKYLHSDVYVFPAKFGYVFIQEYNEEEEVYESRLEKLNY